MFVFVSNSLKKGKIYFQNLRGGIIWKMEDGLLVAADNGRETLCEAHGCGWLKFKEN